MQYVLNGVSTKAGSAKSRNEEADIGNNSTFPTQFHPLSKGEDFTADF